MIWAISHIMIHIDHMIWYYWKIRSVENFSKKLKSTLINMFRLSCTIKTPHFTSMINDTVFCIALDSSVILNKITQINWNHECWRELKRFYLGKQGNPDELNSDNLFYSRPFKWNYCNLQESMPKSSKWIIKFSNWLREYRPIEICNWISSWWQYFYQHLQINN